MNSETVRSHFESDAVVSNYMRSVKLVGLWESEKIVIQKFLRQKESKILELGCGAGRIGLNLIKNGYNKLILSDFSRNMIDAAKCMAADLQVSADCRVCDALNLSEFSDASFDCVIFGFNGLMQIPSRKNRLLALSEIFRILNADGIFIFTTHDRELTSNTAYWAEEKKLWERGLQDASLEEFGDRFYDSPEGKVFIHLPISSEIADDLNEVGFDLVFESLRSVLANENAEVREFSDDCVFRVAKKRGDDNF